MADSRAKAGNGQDKPRTSCCTIRQEAIKHYCYLNGCPLAKGEDLNAQNNNKWNKL